MQTLQIMRLNYGHKQTSAASAVLLPNGEGAPLSIRGDSGLAAEADTEWLDFPMK